MICLVSTSERTKWWSITLLPVLTSTWLTFVTQHLLRDEVGLVLIVVFFHLSIVSTSQTLAQNYYCQVSSRNFGLSGRGMAISQTVQWNPSKTDTTGTQIFVRYTRVSFTEGLCKPHPLNYWAWSLGSLLMDLRLPQAKADVYSGHRCWNLTARHFTMCYYSMGVTNCPFYAGYSLWVQAVRWNVVSSPDPTPFARERVWWVLQDFLYALTQQSWFRVSQLECRSWTCHAIIIL